jgi:hypothetical protein
MMIPRPERQDRPIELQSETRGLILWRFRIGQKRTVYKTIEIRMGQSRLIRL